MVKKRSPKVKKDNFGTKNEFVHTSGGKNDDFWRKLNLFTLLRKRCVFLTKNKFVHTSEKMSIFPENMRKPKEKTTFLKKHIDFFVHFWPFFGRVLSGHFFPAVFFGRFIMCFWTFFFWPAFLGRFFFAGFWGGRRPT